MDLLQLFNRLLFAIAVKQFDTVPGQSPQKLSLDSSMFTDVHWGLQYHFAPRSYGTPWSEEAKVTTKHPWAAAKQLRFFQRLHFFLHLCSLSPGISTNLGNLTSVNATKSEAEMSPITKKYNHHLKTCPWPYCTPCGEHFALVDMALPAQFRKTQSFPFKCTRRTQLVTTSHRDHLQNLATWISALVLCWENSALQKCRGKTIGFWHQNPSKPIKYSVSHGFSIGISCATFAIKPTKTSQGEASLWPSRPGTIRKSHW
jgi:hypothetical protein